MLMACSMDFSCIQHATAALTNDRDFLSAITAKVDIENVVAYLTEKPRAPGLFSDSFLDDLVVWEKQTKRHGWIKDCILEQEPLQTRLYAVKRFSAGLPLLPLVHERDLSDSEGPFIQSDWSDSEEVFLLIAAICSEEDCRYAFKHHASMSLRGDKQFLLKVLDKAPFVFRFVSEALQQDYDLAVLAFSTESPAYTHEYFEWNYAAKAVFVDQLLEQMHENLVLGEHLFPIIFNIISSHIDQGLETSSAWKENIAEMTDVPMGKDLVRLCEALHNVEEAKNVWAEPS